MNKAIFHKTDLYATDTAAELLYAIDSTLHIVREYSSVLKSRNDLFKQNKSGPSRTNKDSPGQTEEPDPSIVVISMTNSCQNRCDFPCAANSMAGIKSGEITASEVRLMTDRLYDRHRPGFILFSGGDPLYRKDIFRHIEYAASRGFKTGIITNGIKCSDRDVTKKLSDSGLYCARINLESNDELVHNTITGNIESFKKTVSGIGNLLASGISTHTNTSICWRNKDHLLPIAEFIHSSFKTDSISMSINTDHQLEKPDSKTVAERSVISSGLVQVLDFCRNSSVRFILNLPSEYRPKRKIIKTPSLTDYLPLLLKFKSIKKDIDKNNAVWKYFS